ncbi:MAG: pentapeptide repeat-containing protein, partial [Chloroflexota bacterium]
LTGANLANASLAESNLRGARLNRANLTHATLTWSDLSDALLGGAKLAEADLTQANLSHAFLQNARMEKSNLCRAILTKADLTNADLTDAILREANLREAELVFTRLVGADLTKADLTFARLVDVEFQRANLTDCRVYGISAWDLHLEGTNQSNLIIAREDKPSITVDNLEVAQFIYLLLNNEKIRDVIDTLTTKAVLILGRFERKAILIALKEELRKRNYLPILFDFDKPASRDFTETVSTLAHLSRFIIADITDPRSIPQELQTIVPNLPSIPIQPLLLSSQREYGMFEHFTRYPWVLPIQRYNQVDDLLASLGEKVIAPAEAKAKELQAK